MNANYFSYCWIHSHDFELWSFTQICLFPLLLLSCQTYFLQPFFSASPPMFFSHGLLTVQSVPGTWNVKSTGKRFMPIFCLPSKGRISLRILKVAFAFVASCLWKKKHDVELFSLPEIYSLYHPPPPQSWCSTTQMKYNRIEHHFSFAPSTHTSEWEPCLLSFLILTIGIPCWYYWDFQLTVEGREVLRRFRQEKADWWWFLVLPLRKRHSSGYWLFLDRNMLDFTFV